MTTYSDGLSQIRENIEWFLQSSKKDDTPTNKRGLSVDVKDIEEATALSGLSPSYLVGDRQTYRASKKDIPVEKPKEKPSKPKEDKPRPTPLADKNKNIELVLKQLELGIITKEEAKAKIEKVDNMYEEGGII